MSRKSGFKGIVDTKEYYQHNYIEAVKTAVPTLYEDTDISIYGTDEDILYSVLGKIIRVVDAIPSLISVSSYETSSLQEHFILRNNKTDVKPYLFNNKIVRAFGVEAGDYKKYLEVSLDLKSKDDFTPENIIKELMLQFKADHLEISNVIDLYSKIKDKQSLILSRSRPQSIASGVIRYYILRNNKDISFENFKDIVKLSELTINKIVKEISKLLDN